MTKYDDPQLAYMTLIDVESSGSKELMICYLVPVNNYL